MDKTSIDYTKGAAPLYSQLKEVIEDKIISGEYKVGQKIETEKELEKKYKVSRITVRQALNELVQEGYLLRQRGRGTIVLGTSFFQEHIVKIKSFTEEMKERGLRPGTLSINVSSVKAGSDSAKNLKIDKGEEIYKVERVRTANEIPILVFETYLPKVHPFEEEKLKKIESLYEFLKENDIQIKRVSECFEVSFADNKLARQLDVEKEFPLMLRTRQSYDSSGKIIEFTKAYYHSKLYKFYLEMESKEG